MHLADRPFWGTSKASKLCNALLSTLICIGASACTTDTKEKSIETPRPYAGKDGWLSLSHNCNSINKDSFHCTHEFLIKLNSINKKGNILTFSSWYNGKAYNTALNCRDFSVYDHKDQAKGINKFVGGYRFDPEDLNNWDTVVGITFCKMNIDNRRHSFNSQNSMKLPDPRHLAGEWKKDKDVLVTTAPYEWFVNRETKRKGDSIIYAVYAAYRPQETVWSRAISWLRPGDPSMDADNNEKHAIYGWRSVECASGNVFAFVPYKRFGGETKVATLHAGIWIPIPVGEDSLSYPIRREYC